MSSFWTQFNQTMGDSNGLLVIICRVLLAFEICLAWSIGIRAF